MALNKQFDLIKAFVYDDTVIKLIFSVNVLLCPTLTQRIRSYHLIQYVQEAVNHFLYWVSQKCCQRVLTKFSEKNFHRGIRNQKLGKVKKFQVWVVRRFFELRAKNSRVLIGLIFIFFYKRKKQKLYFFKSVQRVKKINKISMRTKTFCKSVKCFKSCFV